MKGGKFADSHSALAQLLLKRRRDALKDTSAGSGSGNEPSSKHPKLSGVEKKKAHAQKILQKKKADEAELKEFDSMLKDVDVTSSVEKRALELYDQKMHRFALYEQKRKDEAAASLATVMMRESLATQASIPAPPPEPHAPNSPEKGVGKSLFADFTASAQSEEEPEEGSTQVPTSQAQDLTSEVEEEEKVAKHNTRRSSRKDHPPITPTKGATSTTKKSKVATTIEYIQHVPRSQNHSLASHPFHLSDDQIVRWRKPAWADG